MNGPVHFLCILLLAAVPVLAQTSGNYCPNPGAETGTPDTGPENWEASAGCIWAEDEVHSGRRSFKIVSEGGATVGWTSVPIPVPENGSDLCLSVWAKL